MAELGGRLLIAPPGRRRIVLRVDVGEEVLARLGHVADAISIGGHDLEAACQFGPLVMGEGWVNHHGKHKGEGARGIIEVKNAAHPILKGVTDVFGPSDVYGIRRLTDKDTILMRGAVTKTLEPNSSFVDSKNDPMQPLAWLHPYTAPNGKIGTTFCTTMGASVDLVSEDLRRLLVNAAFFLTGLSVPDNADVSYVDPFYPSFYGFIRDKEFWPGQDMQAEDYGLGKTPHAPDPKGTPNWPFRPSPKK